MIFPEKTTQIAANARTALRKESNRRRLPKLVEDIMHTLVLQNKPRAASSGNSWTIELLGGDSAAKDALREAIRGLEHHPAKAARRSLIDMLTLIETFNYEIKFTEHYYTEDNLEGWTFILQG